MGYLKPWGIKWTGNVTDPNDGLNGRAIRWPRGRVLGGSSSINGCFLCGQPQDFDHWRQLGNIGWAWEDVLPVFKRLETWHGAKAQTMHFVVRRGHFLCRPQPLNAILSIIG